MDAFRVDDLEAVASAAGADYHEFVRSDDLSAGLYVLPPGAIDGQRPHTEDEVYHVVAGRGRIRVGAADEEVTAGAVVFVPAGVEHRFHDVVEKLVVLVVFGPAEYARRTSGTTEDGAAGP